MVNNTLIINAIRVHIYFTSILSLTLKGSNYYLLKKMNDLAEITDWTMLLQVTKYQSKEA